MKNLKIKKFYKIFVAFFFMFFIFGFSALAACPDPVTDPTGYNKLSGAQKVQCGLDQSAAQGYLGDKDTEIKKGATEGLITDIPTSVGKIVGAGLSLIGILFLLLMIYGGIIWMIARGNEQEVEKSKNIIISAVIGLVIVLAAYAITYFIGTQLK